MKVTKSYRCYRFFRNFDNFPDLPVGKRILSLPRTSI